MSRLDRSTFILARVLVGCICGLAGAAAMALTMAAGRLWLGIMPPVEAIPDRVAPLLDIATFFELFGKYGGYDGLKKFGIVSGLRGVAATGAATGIVIALLEVSPWAGKGRRIGNLSVFAVIGAAILGLVAWIGLTVFLWPVNPANYRGVPFSWARWLTIGFLLLCIALFLFVTLLAMHLIWRKAKSEARPSGVAITRRSLATAALGGVLVWPIYRLLRTMYNDATFDYDGLQYQGEDVEPITPNDRFYTVTKNVVDPDVNRDIWRLEIGGSVNNSLSISYDDLISMDVVEQDTTLCCISNRIGNGLISNARWTGVRLADLLNQAGIKDGAYEVVARGADAYVDTFSMDRALQETTLVAFRMNGEDLPRRHGYPVRLIVPGLFGEKNIKWVTRLDVVDSNHKGFYEQQGWGPTFTPPIRSDIFSPVYRTVREDAYTGFAFRRNFRVGETALIRGRAFAGDRGIQSVEVTVDNGETWAPAEIYYHPNKTTWAMWRFEWTPSQSGSVIVYSRAVDGNGDAQPGDARSIVPDGAAGYCKVRAIVE